jgi:hypothetical protein
LVLLIVAAILFPIFAKPHRGKGGFLVNATSHPLANTPIVVRTSGGIRALTTTAGAEFDLPKGEWATAKIDGYLLARRMHRTGGPDRHVFAPSATLEVIAKDEKGQLLKGTIIAVSSPQNQSTEYPNPSGRVVIDNVPAILDNRDVRSWIPSRPMKVVKTKRTDEKGKIRIEYTFGKIWT